MFHFCVVLLKALSFIGGIFFLCVAGFLYRDEEERIQNVLSRWWENVALVHRQNVALSLHTKFMQEVAKLAGRLLDSLLGTKLLSLRVVGVSICYSVGGFTLVWSYVLYRSLTVSDDLSTHVYVLIVFVFAILCIFIGTIIAAIRRTFLRKFWFTGVLGLPLCGVFLMSSIWVGSEWVDELLGFSLMLVVSFACDLCLVAGTRWALRRSSDMDQFSRIAAMMCLNCVLAILIFISPFLFVRKYAMIVMTLNLFELVAASIFFVLAFLMLGHRLLWPVVSRPVYAFVSRVGVRQKLFSVIGIALLTLSTGKVPEWLKKIVEIFSG